MFKTSSCHHHDIKMASSICEDGISPLDDGTKRNEANRNGTKRNETGRSETERAGTERNDTERNGKNNNTCGRRAGLPPPGYHRGQTGFSSPFLFCSPGSFRGCFRRCFRSPFFFPPGSFRLALFTVLFCFAGICSPGFRRQSKDEAAANLSTRWPPT